MPWDVKLRDSLRDQDYLYTILSRDSLAGDTARVIGSIMDYVFVPDDPKAALERLADPSTGIVSLTVTEKGYCCDATGCLDLQNKLIVHDLAPGGLDAPQSAPGLIAAGLKLRHERGIPPFVVLSCDNLPMNGNMARRATAALMQKVDPKLADWVASSAVAFPNSMVDRITPVTTDAEKDVLKEDFGILDGWPVVAEPYVQWVVEDAFGGCRPAWEVAGGVQFVKDVQPYELMKLRLLNSSHSALAYVGYLSGHRLVHDAMDDPLVRGFVTRYMAAVAPTVPPVPGVNLNEYQAILTRRFSNARIADKLTRLAQDGSSKWQSTLALGGLAHSALGAMQFSGTDLGSDPPLFTKYVRDAGDLQKLQRWRRDHLAWRKKGLKGARGEFGADVSLLQEARPAEAPPTDVALALAAWVRYMTGIDEDGLPITLEDPLSDKLSPLAKAACTGAGYDKRALSEFLTLALGEAASSWSELTASVGRWLIAIRSRGIVSALAESLAENPTASTAGEAGGSGADLALVPGGSSAQTRLAVLKLKQTRLQGELNEVQALLDTAKAEANAEMEKIAEESQHRGLGRKVSSNKLSNPRSRDMSSRDNLFDLSMAGVGSVTNLSKLQVEP
jgi:mannitol-1-phosphate/altronate dehydrogenase